MELGQIQVSEEMVTQGRNTKMGEQRVKMYFTFFRKDIYYQKPGFLLTCQFLISNFFGGQQILFVCLVSYLSNLALYATGFVIGFVFF